MTSKLAEAAKILIVDDDEIVRLSIRWMLAGFPVEISEATNGKEALARLEAGPCQLVVLDIMMPEMNGVDTLREIKMRWPFLKVISISGSQSYFEPTLNLKTCLQIGAFCTLEKPFAADVLLRVVKDALNAPPAPASPE